MEIDSILNVKFHLLNRYHSVRSTCLKRHLEDITFFVISHEVNFPFDEIPVFWQPGVNCGPGPLEEWEFEWQGGMWSLYQVLDYLPTTMSATFEVDGCY